MNGALTKTEAMVVEGVHHGLRGLTTTEIAKELGISVRAVQQHLKNAERKAPNLFPILTQTQAQILHLYTVEGLSVSQISLMRGVSVNAIRGVLGKLRKKGVLKDNKPSRPIQFDENLHSDKVVKKW